MIKICYTTIDLSLESDKLLYYLKRLPTFLRKKIQRYRKPEDFQRVLFGKLLLQNGLEQLGCPSNALEHLQYGKRGKPFLPSGPQFNISYGGKYILCAFNTEGAIGIDLEKIRPIELNDYSFLFKGEVFRSIRQAADPSGAFFENWTIREAILKAEGTAAIEEAKLIQVKETSAIFKEKEWYYKPLLLDSGYLAHWATDVRVGKVIIESTVF